MPNLAVVGAGTMGRGIAQVASMNGWEVLVLDKNEDQLSAAQDSLIRIMQRMVDKGKYNQKEADLVLSRLGFTTEMQHLSNSELVIEAIIEDLDIKRAVFSEVEQVVSKDAVIASNTSSLSLASIGAEMLDASRFLGLHFFNPAPLMPLVEIVPAIQTATETVEKTQEWIDAWKKVTVRTKDTPGFIVNRVARPFYGEALRIYEEGIADAVTIDWAMKTQGNFRMGPFELMDFIGNDVNFAVTASVFKSFFYDPRYKPSLTQKRMVEAGFLGRKSGRGYYNYAENAVNPTPTEDEVLGQSILDRILVMLINEAADALFLQIASREDLDLAMTKGVNYPKGLLRWADEKGIAWCVQSMDMLYDTYREDRYRCSPLLRKMNAESDRFFEF
ncbi:MAG: 3-hydroxyacyl-CoA dehydrogenase NAD-binding domain-containing protein [Bacteroidota bacterium]